MKHFVLVVLGILHFIEEENVFSLFIFIFPRVNISPAVSKLKCFICPHGGVARVDTECFRDLSYSFRK